MIFELDMFIVSTHGRPQEFSQGGGAGPKKAPLKTKKAPPQKNEIVLSPFLGGSEACSPEKILTMVLPTTFYMHLSRGVFKISFRGGGVSN